MKKFRKIVLIGLCIALMAAGTLVGCNKKNAPASEGGYTIYVRSMGGIGLPNVTVKVSSKGAEMASGKTDKNGKFTFQAAKGEYDLSVTDLPKGYTLLEANRYKTSATQLTHLILATSSVIKEAVPSDKVYHEGDVIYDFSITDETVTGKPEYTLSKVLETENKKMVLLNFWSLNCAPCMGEMPELERAYREYKEDVEIFGINVPTMGPQTIRNVRDARNNEYLDADGKAFSLTFPLALDENEMPKRFAITSIPLSVVIDRYGVIAFMHVGSMDKAGFSALFEKYISDDYVQDTLPDDGDGAPGEELVREKPTVTQPDSAEIEAAINGEGFNGSYYPETEAEDAEYSWPWLVGETNGEKYIYPANQGVNYSFATIYTSVTISQADIDDQNGKVVLVFDLQWSCENLADTFYVIVNDTLVYEYTGTEQWGKWQDCYALVADEPGEYRVCFLYDKDPQLSEGADTVRIKNMRLISIPQITARSLDMPREAVRGWNGSGFTQYITAVADDDGFYHKDSKTGPYILADMMGPTSFNKRIDTNWSVGNFAVNDYFNYNKVASGEQGYDPENDDTDAITLWAMAGNNSDLYGLTIVNDELIALLNRFAKSQVSAVNSNAWLEFCRYFDHYGTDKSDTGINRPERNPVRGILNITAVPMVEAHNGPFTDLKKIPDQYKNQVVLPRLIVPRGYKYLFEPKESGVYRFRSQSKPLSDTMAWLMRYEAVGEDYLVTTDEQLETSDEEYNFVLTYYLEEGQKYILATGFADLGGTGEYTFTTEYLGTEYYAWQYASRNHFTTADDDMTQIINYENVKPVLDVRDGKYYNALKDADGNYVKDGQGAYVPDPGDPIYVDFITGARFFDAGSLALCFTYSEKAQIVKTLSNIFSIVLQKPKPNGNGWPANQTLASIKGEELDENDWSEILTRLYTTYGDNVYIVDENVIAELLDCKTIGAVADLLKKYYLNFFDQRYWLNAEDRAFYGIPEARFKDYTSIVWDAYQEALENEMTSADHDYATGYVQLTEALKDALDMFCRRIGGFPELSTDWMRLCVHYQYFGPAAA